MSLTHHLPRAARDRRAGAVIGIGAMGLRLVSARSSTRSLTPDGARAPRRRHIATAKNGSEHYNALTPSKLKLIYPLPPVTENGEAHLPAPKES